MTDSSAHSIITSAPEGLLPAAGSDQVVVESVTVLKHERVGPPWATSFDDNDSVVWWIYECETQVDFEDFSNPGRPPITGIVRIERADGVEHTFIPAGPGVPAAVETTFEVGPDMVVIDQMMAEHEGRPFPELRMTVGQAEQLGQALAEAVTVHWQRTHDVYPEGAGRSPMERADAVTLGEADRVSTTDLRTLLGGMSREQMERMLAMVRATAPDQFGIALRALDAMDDDPDPIDPIH